MSTEQKYICPISQKPYRHPLKITDSNGAEITVELKAYFLWVKKNHMVANNPYSRHLIKGARYHQAIKDEIETLSPTDRYPDYNQELYQPFIDLLNKRLTNRFSAFFTQHLGNQGFTELRSPLYVVAGGVAGLSAMARDSYLKAVDKVYYSLGCTADVVDKAPPPTELTSMVLRAAPLLGGFFMFTTLALAFNAGEGQGYSSRGNISMLLHFAIGAYLLHTLVEKNNILSSFAATSARYRGHYDCSHGEATNVLPRDEANAALPTLMDNFNARYWLVGAIFLAIYALGYISGYANRKLNEKVFNIPEQSDAPSPAAAPNSPRR